MKKCPYCSLDVSPSESFCHNCGKPLIVNLETRPQKSLMEQGTYDHTVSRENENAGNPTYEMNSLADESSLVNDLRNINSEIQRKQQYGESTGSLLLKKANIFYEHRKINEAIDILKSALDIFREDDDTFHRAVVHSEMGLLYEELNYFEDAIYHYNQSIHLLESQSNRIKELIKVYNNLGNIFLKTDSLLKSYEIYQKALSLASRNQLLLEEIKISSNLVDVLIKLTYFKKASDILDRNLRYFQESNDIYGLIITKTKRGKLLIYAQKTALKPARDSLNQALQLMETVKDQLDKETHSRLLWEPLLYLGKLSRIEGILDATESYLIRSLEAIRIFEVPESYDEGIVLSELAELYKDKQEYHNSIDYFRLAYEIQYRYGNDSECAHISYQIASLYHEFENNVNKALSEYEKALDLYEELGFLKEQADILHKMGDIYVSKNQSEIAIPYFQRAMEKYHHYKDEYNIQLVSEKIRSLRS